MEYIDAVEKLSSSLAALSDSAEKNTRVTADLMINSAGFTSSAGLKACFALDALEVAWSFNGAD